MGIYEQIDNAFRAGREYIDVPDTTRTAQNELCKWRKRNGKAAISGMYKGHRRIVFFDNMEKRR